MMQVPVCKPQKVEKKNNLYLMLSKLNFKYYHAGNP